jgi:hypothetical protein
MLCLKWVRICDDVSLLVFSAARRRGGRSRRARSKPNRIARIGYLSQESAAFDRDVGANQADLAALSNNVAHNSKSMAGCFMKFNVHVPFVSARYLR